MSSAHLYTLFQWIAERAADRSFVFQTLAHHLNVDLLREAFLRTPKDKAPGVDGVTWQMYAGNLEPNLEDLHRRLRERRYRQRGPGEAGRLRGRSFLIRFADDFVIVCELQEDARRVLEVLPKRLGRFGLNLHPEKIRLVRFRKPRGETRKGSGNGTFDMLGFTHCWGRSRKGPRRA